MKRPRLLLIDDEPALASFVAQVAEDCGFEPLLAESGAHFRTLLREEKPDAIALDLGMPVDGVELLRLLAAENVAAPVLILSGFDRRVLESAFRLGEALGLRMTGPLEKPVRADDLEQVLTSMRTSLIS
ncbi:response regulator [Sphingomonas sinipercae]|uniref:Response regulator n=1 Tax=Sphingomonas sinipercae TaxID=2714944 RepID=A0A6G7ZN84_9SPHN|nr:response regulator [Sphingomonas sinipercae]QIL02444.1 response regulator [Sphingomonas sinipercae]